jgi:hypothetical protein
MDRCSRPHYGRGYCKMHWKRWWRTGDASVVRQVKVPPREICTIKNCGRVHVARGWCGMHLARFYRYGDPLVTRTAPSGEGDSYVLAHQKLRVERGQPSHCEHCGRSEPGHRKYQWAFDHTRATGKIDKHPRGKRQRNPHPMLYSMDVNDYIRLCVGCHKRFDNSRTR